MDLSLLKQFIDDGLAKHKAFEDFKSVVDDAAGIEQYVKELRVEADSIKGLVQAKNAELVSLTASSDGLKAAFRKQSADLDATIQKRSADADKEYAAVVQANQERIRASQAQVTQITSQIAAKQDEYQKIIASVDTAKAAAVAAVQAEVNMWQSKLAAAQDSYNKFIANLPK